MLATRLPQRVAAGASRAPAVARLPACLAPTSSRQPLHVCCSAAAPPAEVPVKGVDGSSKGSKKLALKVAEETAKGLVHRYMVLVLQNKRRVSGGDAMGGHACSHRPKHKPSSSATSNLHARPAWPPCCCLAGPPTHCSTQCSSSLHARGVHARAPPPAPPRPARAQPSTALPTHTGHCQLPEAV